MNLDGNFISEVYSDTVGTKAYHVVTGSGTDSTAVLDGFTITGGLANGSNFDNRGSGMYNRNSSNSTITNATFSGNQANYGGGMYNLSNSSPTITNAAFSGNQANHGGGMFNYESNPTITKRSAR